MKETKKSYIFYLFLYFTLLIGFKFNENSSGGAIHDFQIISQAIISFSLDLKFTYNNYHYYFISHFPYYYILLSFIYKIFEDLTFVKLFVLHLSLLLPFVFYKVLSIRFDKNNLYLVYIPGILFLSTYFRSNAIWALNDNLALTFLCSAIFFYHKAQKAREQKDILLFCLLNIISIVLAAYTRQYYAVLWLFFVYKFFILFGTRVIVQYLFISLVLSLPALYQMFNINSFTGHTTMSTSLLFYSKNLFNNMILIPSIFFIYLLPFYCNKKNLKNIFIFYKKNLLILLKILILVLLFIYFFDYPVEVGGGVIFKIFHSVNFPFLFYLAVLISYLFIFHFLRSEIKENILILFLVIMMIQLNYIFQKYLDPLSLILIFGLFKSEIMNNFINNLKENIKYLYLYFSFMYLGSFFYYYL